MGDISCAVQHAIKTSPTRVSHEKYQGNATQNSTQNPTAVKPPSSHTYHPCSPPASTCPPPPNPNPRPEATIPAWRHARVTVWSQQQRLYTFRTGLCHRAGLLTLPGIRHPESLPLISRRRRRSRVQVACHAPKTRQRAAV